MTTRTLSRGSKARPFAFPGPDEFRKWIEALPEETGQGSRECIVGVSGEAGECPLATFLNAQDDPFDFPGNPRWAVTNSAAIRWHGDKKHEVKLPKWAENFVWIVDHPDPEADVSVGRPITRREALSALDNVVGS